MPWVWRWGSIAVSRPELLTCGELGGRGTTVAGVHGKSKDKARRRDRGGPSGSCSCLLLTVRVPDEIQPRQRPAVMCESIATVRNFFNAPFFGGNLSADTIEARPQEIL